MTIKGAIQPNHMPMNKYQLLVLGLPPLTPTEVSGMEEELETTDLPDRTKASGGQTKTIEFTIKIPLHHTVEMAALESWFKEGQDPVDPNYKKTGSLIHQRIGVGIPRTYTVIGAFVYKRKLPDLAMENEGEMSVAEWSVCADRLLPI